MYTPAELTARINYIYGLELPLTAHWELRPPTIAELSELGLEDTLLEFHLATCAADSVRAVVPLMSGEVPYWLAARAYREGSSHPLPYSPAYLERLYAQQQPLVQVLKERAEGLGLRVQRPVPRYTPAAEDLIAQLVGRGIRRSFDLLFLQLEGGAYLWGRFENKQLTEHGLFAAAPAQAAN